MTRYQAICYKTNLSAAFLLLAASYAGAQSPMTAELSKGLDVYRHQHLQEKLFVHTDKEFYLSGEICWFKLYAVDATSHRPMDLSKVAYLEWLDKDNKPVLQAKAGLKGGHGDGSVYLPLTLRSGIYKLRVYTNWMKNYDADFFFEKSITIVNGRRSAEAPAAETPLQYPVAFFPEGGNLVENLPSKVAFRITDQYGRGVECSGVVTEDDQDTIARFRPYRFGIGQFMLTPRAGHHYRAIFRLEDGTAIANLLPVAYTTGMVMSVVPEGSDQLRVSVQSSVAGSGNEVYLLAHTRQVVKAVQAAMLSEGKASFLVDRKALGEGVSHLTVFNAARQPVCERLVFKFPAHPLQIALHPDKQSYSTRDKINLDVDAGTADCSLAVFRVDEIQTEPANHIASYLWLGADLKGKIESPGYYFAHPEDEQAIDNLMISHGWRRFHWGDVLGHSAPSFDFPPEYNGAIISGKIVDSRTGAPAGNVQAYLSVPGTRTQFTSAYSDDQGRLRFELKDFYGGQELIVQTNTSNDSSYRIEITNPFSETYTDNPLTPLQLPRDDSGTLSDKDVALQVLNRYGGIKLKRLHVPGIDTTVFYFKADHSYLLDDYTRFTTMEEVMREYVSLMLVQKKGDHYHLPLFELPYNQFFETDPLVLLDGVPVFNLDSLMVLDPLKFRKLETVQRKYFLGGTYYSGIMNWTTYKGDLGGFILDPHSTVVDYEGLALQREFYVPSYATEEEKATHVPDFRNVLYWTPTVPTDPQGKRQLSFYSSDIPGKYIVVAEGLAADGSAGSGMATFEVK